MFVPHASEILTKSYGPNYTKFWAFNKKRKEKKKKKRVQKNYNALTPFWKMFP